MFNEIQNNACLIFNFIILFFFVMPRVIKPTKIDYKNDEPQDRERSREKHQQLQQPKIINATKVVSIDSSRRAKILAARRQMKDQQTLQSTEIIVKRQQIIDSQKKKDEIFNHVEQNLGQIGVNKKNIEEKKKNENASKEQEINEGQEQEVEQKILLKPIFLTRDYRNQIKPHENQIYQQSEQHIKEEERKKKAMRHTTKILLQDNMIRQQQEHDDSEGNQQSDDDLNQTNLPSDNDHINEQYEYQLWKIRELKRIRRETQQRQKSVMQKAELDRRRLMNNQEIMLENRKLGSDITDNITETKYVYMQKYYHKGAFYQDSTDQIFKRDYNLPTPLEMQDKSILPEILQKRKGNFGMRGQSKYTHLSNEDTTNFDPQYRPDQSILENWKKKTGGYKSSNKRNI